MTPLPAALLALRALPHPLLVVDADGRLALVNQAMWTACGTQPLPPETTLDAALATLPVLRAFLDAAETGTPCPGADPRHAFTLTRTPLPEAGGFMLSAVEAAPPPPGEAPLAETLDAVLQALPQGVCVWSADRRVVHFNAAYRRLMDGAPLAVGDTLEAVIRRRAADGEYGGEDPAAVFRREMARDISRPQERRRLRPNGTALDVRTAPLPDGGHVSVVSEITQLWRAEEDARRRAGLLETMLTSMRHGIMLFGPDRRLIVANELAGALAGHNPGVVRPGRTNEELVDELLAIGGFGTGAEAANIAERAKTMDRRQPHRGIRRGPDGRVLEISSDPTPDGGFVITHVDITALAEAEAAAEQRADIMQIMLDNIRHGICFFDSAGRVIAANALAARLTGAPPDAFTAGRSLLDIRRTQIAAGEYEGIEDIEKAIGDRWVTPLRAPDRYIRRRPNGLVLEVTTDTTPDGGFVRTYTDVTEDRSVRAELERAKLAAEAASEAKSRFLATMSHELRTPLGAVIGYAEAILAEPGAEHVPEFAEAVREAGRQLLGLIDDILDITRASGGEDRPAHLPVDIAGLVSGLMLPLERETHEAGLRLTAELPADLPHVLSDERRLRRILRALLANAVKFTLAGGSVSLVVLLDEAGSVQFRITDSGIGMAAEDIPRAFEPFTQLDSSHARRFPGSGLGLYLARLLAQTIGATLTLDSTPQKGTTASLRLPPESTISPATASQEAT